MAPAEAVKQELSRAEMERLAKKGEKENLDALVEQGGVTAANARAEAGPLADAGLDPDRAEVLESRVAKLNSDASRRADAKAQAKGHTRSEAKARAKAKAFVRWLHGVTPMILRKEGCPVTAADLAGSARLKATADIVGYLGRIAGPVGRIEKQLEPFRKKRTPARAVDELAVLQKDLQDADETQETSRDALPAETFALYVLKGQVLEDIEDVNRLGRVAFDGDAVRAAKFNKDILLRARRSRSGDGGGGGTPPG